MNRYNTTLFPFALLGLALYIICKLLLPGGLTPNYGQVAPFYAAAMVAFLAYLHLTWGKENERLNYAWGNTALISSEYIRGDFKPERVFDFVKQRYEANYPNWKRRLIHGPVTVVCISMMVVLLFILSALLYIQV